MITNQSSNAIDCQSPITEDITELKIIANSRKLKTQVGSIKKSILFLLLLYNYRTNQWDPIFKVRSLYLSLIGQTCVVKLEELCFMIVIGTETL